MCIKLYKLVLDPMIQFPFACVSYNLIHVQFYIYMVTLEGSQVFSWHMLGT